MIIEGYNKQKYKNKLSLNLEDKISIKNIKKKKIKSKSMKIEKIVFFLFNNNYGFC